MSYSSDVSTGQQATAAQYNALRDDTPKFVELAGNEAHVVTYNDTWQDWDISAIVPAGVICVLVQVQKKVGITDIAIGGARKNGSALIRTIFLSSETGSHPAGATLITECDANRVIELWGDNVEPCYYGILGYWIGVGL